MAHPEKEPMPIMENPRAERVRAAAALRQRSQRGKHRKFLVEGPQSVREALARDALAPEQPCVSELFMTEESAERHPEILDLAFQSKATVRTATAAVIQAMADTQSPQGMIAVARMIDVELGQLLSSEPRLLTVLARVQDPGNAGTILRAADSAGSQGVLFLPGTVDPYNPKLVRSTAGSLFHVPFCVAPADTLQMLKEAGIALLAADGYGQADLDDLLDEVIHTPETAILRKPSAWLFGNEAQGLSVEEEEFADARVRVPIYGQAESLNVGTAATVCLYASARAQRGL